MILKSTVLDNLKANNVVKQILRVSKSGHFVDVLKLQQVELMLLCV